MKLNIEYFIYAHTYDSEHVTRENCSIIYKNCARWYATKLFRELNLYTPFESKEGNKERNEGEGETERPEALDPGENPRATYHEARIPMKCRDLVRVDRKFLSTASLVYRLCRC